VKLASAFLITILLAGLIGAHVATLVQYPAATCDEAGYAASAFSLATAGKPAWPFYPESDQYGRDINIVHHGRSYLLGLGLLLVGLGNSLFVTRLYSLVGGLAAVALTYVVGRKLYNWRVGGLAAIVFATSFRFLLTTHFGRPETWAAAAILVAAYSLLRSFESSRPHTWLLITGFLAAWTLDFHFNALAFVTGIMGLVLWRYGWQKRQWQPIVLFSSGLTAGLIIWIAVHAWPAPEVAWQQLTGLSVSYTGLKTGNPLTSMLENASTIFSYLSAAYFPSTWSFSLLETVLGLLGLGFAVYRRSQADKILVILILISIATFTFLLSQRFAQYSLLWTPWLVLGGCAALEVLIQRFTHAQPAWAGPLLATAAGVLAIMQLGATGWLVYKFRDNNFSQMEVQIAQVVPQGKRVMADTTWWWALKEQRTFISDEYISPPLVSATNKPVDPAWIDVLMRRLHPDYVLFDNALGCNNVGGNGWSDELNYLTQYCQPVARVSGSGVNDPNQITNLLGQTTTIYKCNANG
jgi:MFS family permease